MDVPSPVKDLGSYPPGGVARVEKRRRLVVEIPESVYRKLRRRSLYAEQDLQSMLSDAVERYLDADLIAEWLTE